MPTDPTPDPRALIAEARTHKTMTPFMRHYVCDRMIGQLADALEAALAAVNGFEELAEVAMEAMYLIRTGEWDCNCEDTRHQGNHRDGKFHKCIVPRVRALREKWEGEGQSNG